LIDVIPVNGTKSESKMDFIKNRDFAQEITNLKLEKNIKIWNLNDNKYPSIMSLKTNHIEYWKYFILLGIIFLILEILIIKKLT
jgi:hypothetical protein